MYLQGQLNARPDVSFALSILMLHHFSWSHDGSESNGERPVLNRKLFASAMLALVAASAAHASEGGGSVYLQGTFNDFAVAVSGPPGFYLRNDLVYYDASIDARPRNGVVELGVNQKLWTNLIKVAWIGNGKVLGGTPGLAVALPIILNVDVTATASGFGTGASRGGNVTGLGDIFIVPSLNWVAGNNHFTFAPSVTVPSGKHAPDDLLNLSRNYWSFVPQLSYTYLNPATGLDLSGTFGLLINGRNPDTDYTTGTEAFVDFNLAQHFSETFALAVTGYWYQQISDDTGNVPAVLPQGFRGSGFGLGPAAMKTVKFGSTDVTFIAKWIHDIDTSNRLGGDLVMLSFATKL